MLPQTHARQVGVRLLTQFPSGGDGKQRQGVIVRQAARFPQSFTAVHAERTEGIGIGEFADRGNRQARPAHQPLDRVERSGPGQDEIIRPVFAKAVDLAEAQPQGQRIRRTFQRIVPMAMVDVDGTDLDLMLLGIAHDLGRSIEAHRLAVQQGTGKRRRVPAFDVAGDIDQPRKAGRVAFGKPVGAKALDLLEAAPGEVRIIAAFDHPPDHAVLIGVQGAVTAKGAHGLAQAVGLLVGELGRDHGDLHRLLLKQGDPQRPVQDLFQFIGLMRRGRTGIDHRFGP